MDKFLRVILCSFFIFLMGSCPLSAGNNTNKISKGIAAKSALKVESWKKVIDAIINVESEGNPRAKSGSSVGLLQITPILVRDCNKILKRRKSSKRYSLSDRFNRAKSIEMFMLIQSHYNPKSELERAIRLWNGGLNYTKKGTQRYYEKVMKGVKSL